MNPAVWPGLFFGGAMDYEFLTFEQVCELHDVQLQDHGGAAGIRDENAIYSSMAQAEWTKSYGGDVADIAAAYLFHFAMNQAFVDGNKRTAVTTATTFLLINGYILEAEKMDFYQTAMLVANRHLSKVAAADWIRERLVQL